MIVWSYKVRSEAASRLMRHYTQVMREKFFFFFFSFEGEDKDNFISCPWWLCPFLSVSDLELHTLTVSWTRIEEIELRYYRTDMCIHTLTGQRKSRLYRLSISTTEREREEEEEGRKKHVLKMAPSCYKCPPRLHRRTRVSLLSPGPPLSFISMF